MLVRVLSVSILLLWSPAAFAFQDDRETEREVKQVIRRFKQEMRRARGVDDAVAAIRSLGATKHPLVLKELQSLLRTYRKHRPIAEAVIDEIGAYTGNEDAAGALLSHLRFFANQVKTERDGTESGHELAVRTLETIARIGYKPAAVDLRSYFRAASLEVQTAAIAAAGDLGSYLVVNDLIQLMAEAEATQAQYSGVGQPGIPPPGQLPGAPPGQQLPPGAEDQLAREQYRRSGRIIRATQSALSKITGQNEDGAANWSKWWAKNGGKLVAKEREEMRKNKKRR